MPDDKWIVTYQVEAFAATAQEAAAQTWAGLQDPEHLVPILEVRNVATDETTDIDLEELWPTA
jgi:hypothetical protein